MKFAPRFSFLCAAWTAMAALPATARPALPISHPAPGHRLQFDPHKFMRVGQLRPGMRGYALSVFHGTKIERFGVQILGVLRNINDGRDLILFKMTSGPPVTENFNVAEGMSGSPIYIGGKLVGAISMSYAFSRSPVGLATPIEDMFDAWSPDLPSHPSSMSARAAGPAGDAAAPQDFGPIGLPVTVSGMTSNAIAQLNTRLLPFHLNVMAGGGGGSRPAKNLVKAGAMLQPGAAVGVSLMQGDMDASATGTVTYRDGNRILIFGHPFFQQPTQGIGPIDAALTTASVAGVYPSFQNSLKLGQPLQTVGRIFQDRPFSVGGIIGSLPQMIPMVISVNDLSIKRKKNFHVRVIDHPLLTSQLVTTAADSAISQVHGLPGDSMATVTMDVNVEEIGHVRRTNTFYDAVSIDQAAIGDLDSLMRLLSSNPFYPLSVKSVQMAVTIQNRHDTAQVDHIFVRQNKFAPGDTVSVGVVLKPYKRERITRYLPVKIPANTPDGTLSLSVQGGGEGSGGLSIGGFILIAAPAATGPANNVAQLVKKFTDKPRNNELVAHLTLPTSAIDIDGEKLTDLPPTLAGVIRGTRSTGLHTERDEVKVVQPTTYVISGSESLSITVQKKDTTETPKAPAAIAPMPVAPTTSSSATSEELGVTTHDGPVTADDLTDASSVSAIAMVSPAPDTTVPTPGRARAVRARQSSPIPSAAAGSSGASPAGVPSVPPAPVKTVGRLPSIWRQDTTADFAAGTLKNVSVTSMGEIRLSASLKKLCDTPETYVWSILPDGKGNVYLGTGDRGIVYKMTADGKVSPVLRTGQLEVTALAMDQAGTIYAGTAPHGLVYRIAPGAKGEQFFATQEKYVTALSYDPTRSQLYIATGGGTGRVYRARTGQNAAVVGRSASLPPGEPLFTSPEAHLLSLTTDKAGNVYAGSSPDGIVYKITPDGKSSVFYDAPDPNISALAADSAGNVYAGTTPKGNIYRVAPDGTAKLLSDRASSGVLSLRTDAHDNLYACAGSTIYRIAPDETAQSFTAGDDEQFLTLAADAVSGEVYAGTSTVGSVYSLGTGGRAALQGQFDSVVHDAGMPSRWGTLDWTAEAPPGTHVTLQTRSGDVPAPDTSWSAWSSAYTRSAGETVTSPPGRYLQYRATLTRDAGIGPDVAPKLHGVAVYYLTRNQPPAVRFVSPQDGAAVHKATLLQWSASDPDNDTLNYDLAWSSDGGKVWTPIKKRATPTSPAPVPAAASPAASTAARPVTEQDVHAKVMRMETTLDRQHPGLPPAVRAQLVAQATDTIRRSLQSQGAAPVPISGGTVGAVKETSFSWDTTEVPDGTYQVRVVASDRQSNPEGALTATATSPPFLIANTPPTLTLGAHTVGPDKTVTLHGVARTNLAFVRAVQGHADGGDYTAALADDGLFDSPLEPFTVTLGPLTSGTHSIEVEVSDQAGNMSTQRVTVSVP